MEFNVDQVFAGRYRLISKIGIGGFSEVWKVADQMADESILALKVYAPEKGLDEYGLKQFRREYSVVLNLNHSNLLTARHFDIFDGHPFLIMPFCEGGSVYGRIIEHGTFSEKELAEFLIQIAPALEYLHENEIVHQDIKPDNILIDGKGNYLLMDFGISGKLRSTLRKSTTAAGAMTVAYAPPEKFKGMGIMGAESDVFSLGVMMIEMLTGDVPWNGMGGAYLKSDDDLPELPENFSEGIQELITSCIRLDVKRRIQLSAIASSAQAYLQNNSWVIDSNQKPKNKDEETNGEITPKSKSRGGRKTVKMENLHSEQIEVEEIVKPKKSNKKVAISLVLIAIVAFSVIILRPWKRIAFQKQVTYNRFDSLRNLGFSDGFNGDYESSLYHYTEAQKIYPDSISIETINSIQEAIQKEKSDFIEKERALEKAKNDSLSWQEALKSNTINAYESYLNNYETGIFSKLANDKIKALKYEATKPKVLSYSVNGISFEMVEVLGGSFTMGCTNEQKLYCSENEKPAHKVTLSSYQIGKFEVTQSLWQAVMGSNPSAHSNCLNCPVELVSWNDVKVFIDKLNNSTGKNFRLPTEAEWEYAARGGNRSKGYMFAGSNGLEVAWYNDNSKQSSEVGKRKPNELGIYDMSGNVWEFCNDYFGDYSSTSKTNPKGPSTGDYRVSRGSGWPSVGSYCRVSYRSLELQDEKNSYLGFRLVL